MNHQLRDEIKARKEKEEALRRSEEKYRSIIEKMENGYYEMDLEGKLTFFNNPLVEILGYPEDEMPGLSFRSYLNEETIQLGMEKFSAVRRTGMRENMLRNTIVRKDGSRAHCGGIGCLDHRSRRSSHGVSRRDNGYHRSVAGRGRKTQI